MSALEKLIFLSDMLEEGRDFAGIDKLRELFWDRSDDLTKCMAHALSQSLEFLREKGGEVYALTVQAANYYKKLIQKENGHD